MSLKDESESVSQISPFLIEIGFVESVPAQTRQKTRAPWYPTTWVLQQVPSRATLIRVLSPGLSRVLDSQEVSNRCCVNHRGGGVGGML